MKIIAVVGKFGRRAAITIEWTRQVYFLGREPEAEAMITVELPGLRRTEWKYLVRWLSEHARGAEPAAPADAPKGRAPRRELARIPEDCWRPTVLDDFIDADDYAYALYWVNQRFPLAAFHAFGDRWLLESQRRMDMVLAEPEGRRRLGSLKTLGKFLSRVYGVMGQCPARVEHERATQIEQLDRVLWETARAESRDYEQWIGTAGGLHTPGVRQEALLTIARELAQDSAIGPDELAPLLDAIARRGPLRTESEHYPEFWEALEEKIRLEPNAAGETIDITEAREETVDLGWGVLRAKRAGAVVPGRTALVVYSRGGRPTHYIRGERKLKFQVAKAGGQLQKYGCTLVQQSDARVSLHPAILEVDRLDTLANVDPAQAVETLRDLNLPAHHPVFAAAAAAKTDARQSRVLADLLIELRFGIDSDVARNLARAQSRANRR